MSGGAVQDFRDEPLSADELAMLNRARGELVTKVPRRARRVLPAGEVIDMDVRRVQAERFGTLVGRVVGIGFFGGIVFAVQGGRWVAGRVRAWR